MSGCNCTGKCNSPLYSCSGETNEWPSSHTFKYNYDPSRNNYDTQYYWWPQYQAPDYAYEVHKCPCCDGWGQRQTTPVVGKKVKLVQCPSCNGLGYISISKFNFTPYITTTTGYNLEEKDDK